MLCAAAVLLLCFLFASRCRAGTLDDLNDSLSDLRGSVSDEVTQRLEAIGYDGGITSVQNISLQGFFSQIAEDFSAALAGPLSSCAVIVGVIILSSLLEGYTQSLRYTETRDIMAAVTSLMIAAALISPLVSLIQRIVGVITDTSSLMLLFVPIMIGILSFSGHAIQAGGYYAAVMTASQVIAQLSSRFIPQLMCAYLGLSITSGVSGRVKLSGAAEMIGRFMKWFLIFMMTLFSAILSLQSVISRAGDSVANRAVRFTLSSLIPFIGSAVSEAYKTIQGSVDLLRSGAGVFVILAVIVAFVPVLIQVVIWLLTVNLSRCAAEALGVMTPASLLAAVSSVLSVLIALIVSVMSVFIISAAVLIRIGGAS